MDKAGVEVLQLNEMSTIQDTADVALPVPVVVYFAGHRVARYDVACGGRSGVMGCLSSLFRLEHV